MAKKTLKNEQFLGLGVLTEAIENKPNISVKRAVLLACRVGCAADAAGYVSETAWYHCAGRTKESQYVWNTASKRFMELAAKHFFSALQK